MDASTETALDDLRAEFDLLGSWEERFQHVMDLGRALEPLTAAEQSDVNKVRGCASQVWLVREQRDDGRLYFRGLSDSALVRGLIAILLRLYSGRTPDEILAIDARAVFDQLDLPGNLTRQRSNGLFSMVERIRRDAEAAKAG